MLVPQLKQASMGLIKSNIVPEHGTTVAISTSFLADPQENHMQGTDRMVLPKHNPPSALDIKQFCFFSLVAMLRAVSNSRDDHSRTPVLIPQVPRDYWMAPALLQS